MSVANGQKANSTTFNDAFMSKSANSTTTGVMDFNNSSDPDSGARITNVQQAVNEIFDAVGMSGIDDATRKDYSTNNFVSDGDSHKTAIGKLDTAIQGLVDYLFPVIGTRQRIVLANNQTDGDVSGLLFDSDLIKSFEFTWTAYRETTGGGANIIVQRGSIIGCFNGTDWEIVEGPRTPTDAGITFSINTVTGQVTYTTSNQAGTYDADLAWLDTTIWDVVPTEGP